MPTCEHCLIDFPERAIVRGDFDGGEKIFCCPGCMGIYSFIRGEGLDSYYRKRRWNETGPQEAAFQTLDDVSDFSVTTNANDVVAESSFYLDGIRCASCVWLVEKVLSKTPGVQYARVNYATHRAKIKWDAEKINLAAIVERIRSTGYAPKPWSETERASARKAEERDLLIRLGTSGFLSMNLMAFTAALYAGYFQGMNAPLRLFLELVATVIAIPAVFYAGYPILRSAALSLSRLHFNMDVLIALGSLSAFAFSVYGMFSGGGVYYDTSAMIVMLILIGRYIESSAKSRASETIERLAELAPKRAELIAKNEYGIERKMVAVSSLKSGDLVAVAPGARFPIDGVVRAGESEADESLVTGESKPVTKRAGDLVIGGSVNMNGALEIAVTRVGADTTLAAILRAVVEAQERKPAIQGFADRVVGVFVPAVIFIAVVTGAAWIASGATFEKSLMTAISVVVIACPCSLGLATPIAVLVYVSAAHKRGILIKTPETIERAAKVTSVVLDKTGTLTVGKPSLVTISSLDETTDEKTLLDIAANLEARSEHSIAKAIVKAADERNPSRIEASVADFKVAPGMGVSGRIGDKTVFVGNRAFLEANGIVFDHTITVPDSGGRSVAFMGWNSEPKAAFFVSDAIRPEAARAVAELKSLSLSVSIVSGDSADAVKSAAESAGVSDFKSGVSPVGKCDLVAERQRRGETVAMIGDGINDAPALTEAAVAIAMGRGADVSMESADAVLTVSDLTLIPYLVRLSRGANRIVKQNVFWAFAYNVLAIPLAARGILHPIVAAGAMAVSSLVVVFNSLRVSRMGRG